VRDTGRREEETMPRLLVRHERAVWLVLVALPFVAVLWLASAASADRSNNRNAATVSMTCSDGGTETVTVTTIPRGIGTPYQVTIDHGIVYPKLLTITVDSGETFVILDRPGDVPPGLAVTCTGQPASGGFTLYLQGFKTP
jgi:hypothetical protein